MELPFKVPRCRSFRLWGWAPVSQRRSSPGSVPSFSFPDVGRAPPLGKECREAWGLAGGFQDLGEEAGTRLPAQGGAKQGVSCQEGRAKGYVFHLPHPTDKSSCHQPPSLSGALEGAQNPKRLEHWGTPRQSPRWTKSSRSGMKPLPRNGLWRLSWTRARPSYELQRPSCWKSWRRN